MARTAPAWWGRRSPTDLGRLDLFVAKAGNTSQLHDLDACVGVEALGRPVAVLLGTGQPAGAFNSMPY